MLQNNSVVIDWFSCTITPFTVWHSREKKSSCASDRCIFGRSLIALIDTIDICLSTLNIGTIGTFGAFLHCIKLQMLIASRIRFNSIWFISHRDIIPNNYYVYYGRNLFCFLCDFFPSLSMFLELKPNHAQGNDIFILNYVEFWKH